METNISAAWPTVLGAGKLKNGAAYEVALLTPVQADEVASLHAATISSFEPEEKTYLLPKNRDYFVQHMMKRYGNAIIGLLKGKELIGQALVRHPTKDDKDDGMVSLPWRRLPPSDSDWKKYSGSYPEQSCWDTERNVDTDEQSVLQAVTVAAAYRNQGLMGVLTYHWLQHAKNHGRKHAFAEIDVRNKKSWTAFLTGGLKLDSIGRDPADGTLIYNAYAPVKAALKNRLKTVFNEQSGELILPWFAKPFLCAFSDIDRQRGLFKNGCLCVAYNKAADVMVFLKERTSDQELREIREREAYYRANPPADFRGGR